MDAYLLRIGFVKSFVDANLYIEILKNEPVIILLYQDDLFITGVERRILECKKMLAEKFEMKDHGLMHYYLGLEVWQKPVEIYLGQGKYIIKNVTKVWYDGFQAYDYSHDHKSQEVENLWF